MEIRNCPFCKSHDVQIDDLIDAVSCNQCQAIGPDADSREQAIDLWNAADRSEVIPPAEGV